MGREQRGVRAVSEHLSSDTAVPPSAALRDRWLQGETPRPSTSHIQDNRHGPPCLLSTTIHQSQKIMLMKTVVIRIHGPVASKQCVAYLDDGSSLTLIEKDLAEEMDLSMKPDTLRIRTMTRVTEHDIGKLNLRSVSSVATGGEFALRDVVAVDDKLELSKNPVTVRDLADKYPHIEDMEIPHLD